jgi:GxxExxY protein
MAPYGESTSERVEQVAKEIVDAAFKVHSTLGPGLLESVYAICLTYELRKRGLRVDRELKIPIVYDEVTLDAGLRVDMLVEGCVIVDTKAVERLIPVFEAQVQTYLRLTKTTLGFLINFNVPLIKDGIKRVIETRRHS